MKKSLLCCMCISGTKIALCISYFVLGIACFVAGVSYYTDNSCEEVGKALFTCVMMGILYIIPGVYLIKDIYKTIMNKCR
jgi:hypothetical protein